MIWASNSGGRQISHISQMQAKEERSSKILFEFFCSQRQRYSIFAIHCFSETPPRSEQMTSKRISLDRFSCPTSEAISIKWCAFFQCTWAAAYVALGSTERCAVQWRWRFRPPKTINLSSSVRGRRNPNLFDPPSCPTHVSSPSFCWPPSWIVWGVLKIPFHHNARHTAAFVHEGRANSQGLLFSPLLGKAVLLAIRLGCEPKTAARCKAWCLALRCSEGWRISRPVTFLLDAGRQSRRIQSVFCFSSREIAMLHWAVFPEGHLQI